MVPSPMSQVGSVSEPPEPDDDDEDEDESSSSYLAVTASYCRERFQHFNCALLIP